MLKVLVPAYGRKYGTFEQLKEDLENGKDFFSVTDNAYCSVRDFPEMERDAAFVGERLNFKMCADHTQSHFWFVFGDKPKKEEYRDSQEIQNLIRIGR